MAHDRVFVENTVGTVNVSGDPSDLERNVHVVHLGEGNLFGEPRAIVFLLAQVVGQQLSFGNFTQHPGQLVLNQLVRGDGVVELDARQSVGFGAVETRHGRAQRTP